MFRLLIASLCLAFSAATAAAQAKDEKKALTIRWFGQSFFQIETGDMTKIVIDPHAMMEYGRPTCKADLVLINTNSWNLFPLHNATNAIVEACHVGNVDTVFVAGKIVKEHGRLLGFAISDLRSRAETALENLYSRAGVPVRDWVPKPYSEGTST